MRVRRIFIVFERVSPHGSFHSGLWMLRLKWPSDFSLLSMIGARGEQVARSLYNPGEMSSFILLSFIDEFS
jgi:hypothetical protein